MKKVKLKLVTPVKVLFEEEVDAVYLPTTTGQIGVLAQHAYLVSVLIPGELIIKNGSEQHSVAIAGGLVEVFNNHLIVLADSAELASDIDITQAEAAAEQLASEIKKEVELDRTTYSLLQRNLEFEKIRAELGTKWRKLKK